MDAMTLQPPRGLALRWTAAGVLLVALGVWFLVDSGGAPQMWVLFGIMVAVATWFLLQLVVPSWFRLQVSPDGVRSRSGWQVVDVGWDRIEDVSIRAFAGECYLRLEVIEEVPGGWVVVPRQALLPLGCDVAAVRLALVSARAEAFARHRAAADPAVVGA